MNYKTVNLSIELHKKVKTFCAAKGMSIPAWISKAFSKELELEANEKIKDSILALTEPKPREEQVVREI